MALRFQKSKGFTLIEMLVVLAIVGILTIVGVTMIGNKQAGSVRALLDELEGCIANAQKASVATGRDVAIVNWGAWTPTNPAAIAQGDASLTAIQIQDTAKGLLAGVQPDAALAFGQTVAIPFHLQPNVPSHSMARIAMAGTTEWADAMKPTDSGTQNQAIATVSPFKAGEIMASISATDNFFSGDRATALVQTSISGTNKRFTTTFVIPVVGTTRSGGVLPGGPMGLIVVLANGGSIYKFYNPGVRDGNGLWRRI